MSTFSIDTFKPEELNNLGLSSTSSEMMKPMSSTKHGWGTWLFRGCIALIGIWLLYTLITCGYKKYEARNMSRHRPQMNDMNMQPPVYDDTDYGSQGKPVPGSRYATFEENPY